MDFMGLSTAGMYNPLSRSRSAARQSKLKEFLTNEPIVVDEEQADPNGFIAGLPYHLIGVNTAETIPSTENTGYIGRHKHTFSNVSSASNTSSASDDSSASYGSLTSSTSSVSNAGSGSNDSCGLEQVEESKTDTPSSSALSSSSASLAEDMSPSWPLPDQTENHDDTDTLSDRTLLVRSPSRRLSISASSSRYRRFSSSASSLVSMSELNLCEAPLNIVPKTPPFPVRSSSLRSYSRPSSRSSTLNSECSTLQSRPFSARKNASFPLVKPLVPLYEERFYEGPKCCEPSADEISEVLRDYQMEVMKPEPPVRPPRPDKGLDLCVKAIYRKELNTFQKRKVERISSIDISQLGSTVVAKQGKNILHFWDMEYDALHFTIKISDLFHATNRYCKVPIHNHVILSDKAKLIAVSTRLGNTIEIWNWAKKKKLQRIDQADRWVAARFETLDEGWSPLAAFRAHENAIDLYAATDRRKKPFAKVRSINVCKAGLPLLLDNPQMAISRSSPLLVAAAGPRSPKVGQPPPEHQTILVAWDISDYREVSNAPHRFVCPWQYKVLETATPCALETHENLVVSIWTPADHRVYRHSLIPGQGDWRLTSVNVRNRHVLLWNLNHNGTRMYEIPNTTCCISPDCRYIAYSLDTPEKRSLVILNATTGEKVWSMIEEYAIRSTSQAALDKAVELTFSSDGGLLIVSDAEGHTKVYDIIEMVLGSSLE